MPDAPMFTDPMMGQGPEIAPLDDSSQMAANPEMLGEAEFDQLIGQIPEEVAQQILAQPPEAALEFLVDIVMETNNGVNASSALQLAKLIYSALQKNHGESEYHGMKGEEQQQIAPQAAPQPEIPVDGQGV